MSIINKLLISSKINVNSFTFDMSYYERGKSKRVMRFNNPSKLIYRKKLMF